jgi:hypothetical protein
MINIAFRNESTVVTDEDAAKVVAALQIQVSRDFYPAWGIDAKLMFAAKGFPMAATDWQIIILDNSDQAEALGYHETSSDGLPIGKVFAKSDIDNGLNWSVTASHELLEMLADPCINLTVLREEVGQLWAYEVADACESDDLGYLIDGVLVSDFVFPSWFESFWQRGATQFDFQKKIQEPFELLLGGYIGFFDLKNGNGWQQLTAQHSPKSARMRPKPGSRRDRRRLPRADWQKSER